MQATGNCFADGRVIEIALVSNLNMQFRTFGVIVDSALTAELHADIDIAIVAVDNLAEMISDGLFPQLGDSVAVLIEE